jgi:hypothetical protein
MFWAKSGNSILQVNKIVNGRPKGDLLEDEAEMLSLQGFHFSRQNLSKFSIFVSNSKKLTIK